MRTNWKTAMIIVGLWSMALLVWVVRVKLERREAWWFTLPANLRQRFNEVGRDIGYHLHIQDRPRAVQINCVNNMKQIGLALRIWSGDNRDEYPFNVSTNQGGSLEWCARNSNGFDRNAWRHLLPMSNELNTPKIVVCPKDKTKKAATNWLALGPANVTYWVRTGTNVDESNPNEVVAVCPVCGTKCFADGHVEPGPVMGRKHWWSRERLPKPIDVPFAPGGPYAATNVPRIYETYQAMSNELNTPKVGTNPAGWR